MLGYEASIITIYGMVDKENGMVDQGEYSSQAFM